MVTSEFEYFLIAELIGMPDRELAQKIELHIWYRCSVPQPHYLAKYVQALRDSEEPPEFYEAARKILEDSGLEFFKDEKEGFQIRTAAPKVKGYVEITQEMFLAAEMQEPLPYKEDQPPV